MQKILLKYIYEIIIYNALRIILLLECVNSMATLEIIDIAYQ